MSSTSPTISRPLNATNATRTISSPPTTVTVDSPPPPTQTTMPVDFPPPPPGTIPVDSTPTLGAPERQSMPHGTVGIIVGVGIGGMSMLVAIALFFFFCRRSKKKNRMMDNNYKNGSHRGPPMHHQNNAPGAASYSGGSYPSASVGYSSGSEVPLAPKSPGMGYGMSQSAFTYEELARATNGFSRENLLGQGGFGYVHKGVLPNGKVVAVKQLKAGSGQGEREFQAEVEIISRVHHRHLVSLVGYCISGAQRMLIYEFVPNGTMEFHLHGKGNSTMMWSSRMKIAIGSAKGLAYLHEDCQPKIIHRDIKAANILIDNQFEAKVADFGLAKFSADTDTHVSTRVMGTFGYLAPEYASSGKLTEKSDVFSFGVVLLELITGRYPIDKKYNFADDSMVEWARPLLKEALENGNFKDIIDPKLQSEYNSNEMKRMIACAAASVRHSARLRPRMSQIVRALEGNMPLDELSEGIKPGHSTVYSSSESQDYNTKEYNQDMENFRKLALESQELTTGEYSVPSTRSAGLNPSGWSTSDGQYTSGEIEADHLKKRGQ